MASPTQNQFPRPRPEFKQSVRRVLAAILFFTFSYALLVTLALCLGIGMIVLGVCLLVFFFGGMTLLISIALIASGGILSWFILQAFFIFRKERLEGLIEITEQEDPKLFSFVREVTTLTGTPFPKRIYLTADVSASVFFESTWLSLLFPVRKNLVIGLGLVNALSAGEFKAVIAHEFGHFSQKSMRLGSYVYQVNSIIHRMIYDNSGVSPMLQRMAAQHWTIAAAAQIAAAIIRGIQWLIVALHGVVNLAYQRLSREMEFNADGIAASVAGGEQLTASLYRLHLMEKVYSFILSKAGSMLPEQRRIANVYPHHTRLMLHVAEDWQLPIDEGRPQVSREWYLRHEHTRVDVSRQWESHPRLDERETHVLALGYVRPHDSRKAWDLFSYPEKWQERLTHSLYDRVPNASQLSLMQEDAFGSRLFSHWEAFQMPSFFQDYFTDRQVEAFNEAGDEGVQEKDWSGSSNDLFGEPYHSWPQTLEGLGTDIEVCGMILDGKLNTRGFEFEGRKQKASAAGDLRVKLVKEQGELLLRIKEHDRRIVRLALQCAGRAGMGDDLRRALRSMANADARCTKDKNLIQKIEQVWQPLLENRMDATGLRMILKAFEPLEQAVIQSILKYEEEGPSGWGVSNDVLLALKEYPRTTKMFVKEGNFNSDLLDKLFGLLRAFHLLVDWRRARHYQEGLRVMQKALQSGG